MSDIVLSAGVRQNLLALQQTADLMSLTQNRLATGKRVNSALDNPTNFFTSQGLHARSNDLNGLLDSIVQAQQTLNLTDQGITSLTKLVDSAKSIAKQAMQAPPPGSTTYNAFTVAGAAPTAETLGTVTGAGLGATLGVGNGGNLVITANGTNYTVALADGDDISTIVSKINAVTGAAGANVVTASDNGSGQLKLDAITADVDFSVNALTDDVTSTALGLAEGVAHNSTSLLDNLIANGGASGDTLTVKINGGANQVITFGTGPGQISTLAELNTTISNFTGLGAGSGANGSALTFNVSSAASQNSLLLTSSTAGLTTTLGLGGLTGITTQGTATIGAPDFTRTSLEKDFNNVLSQIDALAGDSSYNGINLLMGDQLKIVFNETGTSSLTVQGVTFDSTGLGLSTVTTGTFQNNANIDAVLAGVDNALKTLRTQASAFGANLNTVQTRQDFTKGLIQTLETGADALVLADTNEEGANLLALQTRQSLSSTALSLSAQNDQAVLRLFGGG
ncbi:MAG: flagellin [Xanthobacteraceae bacterium]|uniref:flagellin N-terminal helical domain-containing protein n=1 Tax=Pseudolabrys sp. TaxID=1960880 RepID=UPI003D134597